MRMNLIAVAAWALASTLAAAQEPGSTKPAAYASAADIPVETFFRRAQYTEMAISPDGSKLAALSPRNGRENLVVMDLRANKATAITNFSATDVADFEWVSNDRLYLRSADMSEASGSIYLKGAYAIDADGNYLRDMLFPLEKAADREARRNSVMLTSVNISFRILSRTFDGSGEVIAEIFGRSQQYADVYRYNTRTGQYKLLTFDTPGNVVRWVLDRDLVPRIAIRREERTDPTKPRTSTIWHRASAEHRWEKIGTTDGPEQRGNIQPIAFDYDNKTLLVSSNIGRDKRAIYKYDVATGQLGEQLVQHPLIDLNGGLIFSHSRKALLGIRFNADKPDTAWFNEDMAKLQAGIDKALPGRLNQIDVADDAARFVLIYSVSATDPGAYYLYDTEQRKLQEIAKSREWLPASLMGERRFIKYKARDGLEIPAWLTLPRGSTGKNLPLVVHIHGGPWVRGFYGIQWGRAPVAQFLASRGYAVLEPEPRGSTGYGRKHYVSSFKQWGLAMQNDITDGALHLAAEGIVDKNRMCLFGGSYGGYATLQGLVNEPDLWRCGSAYVAVTDLELMQTVTWSDTARLSDYYETDFKRLVGDKDRDREQFLKTSPAKNADKIKAPVMLTMGAEDQRVPLIHGSTMRDALQKAGKRVDYTVYNAEAHGFNKAENVVDFYSKLEKFLAENLKP